jgi:hypothetical protein
MFTEFWNEFVKHQSTITDLLNNKNSKDYNTACMLIHSILQMFNLHNSVSIHLGIDIRNGTQLPERVNSFELIISPMFHKKNIESMEKLAKASKLVNISNKFSIIKYKFFKPHNEIKISYDKVNINKENLSFLIFDKDDNHISFILFIDDDKIDLLTNKTDINGIEMYIPKDNSITSIIDNLIGEYNMLNNVEFMEIQCKSLLNTKFENLVQHVKPIAQLYEEISTINTKKNYKVCARCMYSNKNINLLVCKSTKKYYCDTICQKAYIASVN